MPIKFPIFYERSGSGESAVLVGADAELIGELWAVTEEEVETLVSMANKGAYLPPTLPAKPADNYARRQRYAVAVLAAYAAGQENAFEVYQQFYPYDPAEETDAEYVFRCASELDWDDGEDALVYIDILSNLEKPAKTPEEPPKPHPYAGKKMGHPDGDMSYRCGSDYCRCAQ